MSSADNVEGVIADNDGHVNFLVLKKAKNARQLAAHSMALFEIGDNT